MIGIGLAQSINNHCLGHAIDLGDEVIPALIRDFQTIQTINVLDDDFAGITSGANSDVEHGVHGEGTIQGNPPTCQHLCHDRRANYYETLR